MSTETSCANAPVIFSFNSIAVRTFVDDKGNPSFCATDVCKVLGYTNAPDAITKHCRKDGIAKRDTIDSIGRKQELTFIDEGNLYRLIIKSRKPEAEPFEHWVMDEVLPTIRKTGSYTVRNALQELPPAIAPHQQNALQVIVARKSGNNGAIRAMLWSRFNNHFRLGSYKQLPADRFDEAVTYLEAIQTAHDPARLPGGHKVYQYPKTDLNRSEQGYPALLNIREMAMWSATSPTYRLLAEMQADGHNVEAPVIEWCAMMEANQVADDTLREIMHMAWERMGQPSRLAGLTA